MGERESGGDVSKLIQSLRDLGAPEDEIAKVLAKANAQGAREAERVGIEPENAGVVRLFFAMQTQWDTEAIVAGNKLIVFKKGLKYEALEPVARGVGVSIDEALLGSLRILEGEVLRIHRERQEQALRQR